MPSVTTPARLLLATAGAVLLAACGTAGGSPPGSSAPTTGSPTQEAVVSCGVATTVAEPPERVVTIKSSATEMVLALGAGDRLVGTAYLDGELPPHLAGAGAGVPVLAEKNPSPEAVLELEPDLVYAGWESNLSADGAGERSMYAGLGISTYVSPSACKGEHQPEELSFELVFDEISEVGALLGEEEAAAGLVAEQRAALGQLTPAEDAPRALWYSSGSDVPYVGAGSGAPQMIMAAVGLRNVAADVDDTWTSLAWEAVAERAPEVIVLVDSAWNSAEHKIEVLEANPVTAALPAVQEGRYLTVPFAATEAGVRNVPAALDLAEQLAELGPGTGTPAA